MQEAAAVPAGSPARTLFSKSYRAWLLFILALTTALNLADRQTMGVTGQAIKLDLGLSDAQMGLVQGLAFAIFYSVLALPVARLAERVSRTRILSASLAVFGVMICFCSKASSFWQLLACRVGVGIADAGFACPVGSLIGDHYDRSLRASTMSVIWLGAPAGVVFAAPLSGWIAEHVGWRPAFIAVGAPAILVAILAFLTLREPQRGMSDRLPAAAGPPPPVAEVLRFLFSKPSVRHLLAGSALAAVAMNGIGQFFAPFIIRAHHLGFGETGRVLSFIAGGAIPCGMLLGGFGVDWAAHRDRRWHAWGPALTLLLAAPAFIIGFNQPTVLGAACAFVLGHMLLFVYWSPTLAMAQNMVGASMRASSTFVFNFTLGLVGIGLGPTLVGLLSDRFAQAAFTAGNYALSCPDGHSAAGASNILLQSCADASATGLRHALIMLSALFFFAGIHYCLASRTLRRDLDKHYIPPVSAASGTLQV